MQLCVCGRGKAGVGLEITARKQPCCFCPAVMEQSRELIAKAISCPSLPSFSSWSPPFSLSQLSHTHKNIPFSSCIGNISRLSLLSGGEGMEKDPGLAGNVAVTQLQQLRKYHCMVQKKPQRKEAL